ncbi:hypothetical protein [Rhizobium leguminosarum]|uniref:Uncharacterized protein n=1 Tax=Rhizobium leguminosarum TaxID=384 RepID=A0A7K3VP74_RHILE|nr:hypothetical protein [Rhizobium leguminosarum]NEK18985.1 hypothetical protein [Rhizobium leguminosarum]
MRMFSFLDGLLKIDADEIMKRTSPLPSDTVLISGTLVEGIGNKHSDIDVYVITDELPDEARLGKHQFTGYHQGRIRQYYDYIGADGFGFDVEYYTWTEVQEMISQVGELYRRARSHTKILRQKLKYGDDDALHKFRVGECLTGKDRYKAAFDTQTWKQLCFTQYRNKTGGFPEFKDMMGAWGSGDYDTSLFVCRAYLADQAAGLYHLTGISNTKPKWIAQNLKRLPVELHELAEDILRWFFEGTGDHTARKEAVLKACDLLDRIYAAEQRLLASDPTFYSPEEALLLTEEEFQRELYHDPQTLIEFEHRRLLFSGADKTLRQFMKQYS